MSGSLFLIIFVIIGQSWTGAVPVNDQFSIESPWKELLEMVKRFLKEGYPAAGVAPMDPFELKNLDVDLPGQYFKLKASIRNGSMHGLSDFKMNKFEFTTAELSVDFSVTFPILKFSAEHYEMEGAIIEAFPLAGQGIIHFDVYDFSLSSKIYLRKFDDKDSLFVDRFENPGFSVTKIVSKTQYDGNFDDILNAMAEHLLAGYLNRFNKYIAVKLTDRIIGPLNDVLGNL